MGASSTVEFERALLSRLLDKICDERAMESIARLVLTRAARGVRTKSGT